MVGHTLWRTLVRIIEYKLKHPHTIEEMPGGGQLPLVAFGNQNRVISGNPDMTFFYKVFKRFTHFSQESITILMDGPTEMSLDTPIRIRAKIPRHADLLSDLTLVFAIPDIYSKMYHGYNPSFRWIHMFGAFIISSIGIYIGGSKVQEFPGEWIALRAQMDMPIDTYSKWRTMIGDTPEMHTPERGVYGNSPNYPYDTGNYPHNIADPSGATAPSIPSREIRVPLPFWFTESIGKALPLVALQLHEVEIQITFRSLREVYRIMDVTFNKEPNRYGISLAKNNAFPTSIDPNDPDANDNLTLQNEYGSFIDVSSGLIRTFYSAEGTGAIMQDGFIMNAHLEGNYIYITDKERQLFAQREVASLVHQVQIFQYPGIVSRTKFDIDAHNLVHRMVFFARRSDAIPSRNDYINMTNWKSGQAPYWPVSTMPYIPNSGKLLPYSQRDILKSARLLCAGTELFEEKPAMYFELQNAFTSTTGGGMNALNPGVRPDDVIGPIYQIPFAFHASDHEQPSGSLNSSRLREFQLEVNPWQLDPNSQFVYDFTVYIESLNLVKFTNGMGGMAFAV